VRSPEEEDNQKKWEGLRNIYLGSSQNGMRHSQLPRSTRAECCCVYLLVERVSNCPVIFSKLDRCCVYVYSDNSLLITTKNSWLWDLNSTFFDKKDVFWCLPQEIPEILHEPDAKHHIMRYGYHCYSQCSDGQSADLALFKSIRHINLDLNNAACLYVVHILQHPASRPSTK